MKDETRIWLEYSKENLDSARILLRSELLNPCLQNVQQSVEKSLKALCVENLKRLKRTHSISELKNILLGSDLKIDISEEECEFLDSIYLPSKYPLCSVLPYYEPDVEICNKGIAIAENVFTFVNNVLNAET